MHDGELLIGSATYATERQLVLAAHGVEDPALLNPDEVDWIKAETQIVAQFSRTDPASGKYQTISPSRVQAITPITIRHVQLQYPARGRLSNEDILYAWGTNMPANDGTRHPDALFDMARMNFGTDEPTSHIERSIMARELERREVARRARSTMHALLAQLRFRGDVPENLVDGAIDSL